MVLAATTADPNRLLAQVSRWTAALRSEANAGLADLEAGLRRATDELSAAIAHESTGADLPPFDRIEALSERPVAEITSLLHELGKRMAGRMALETAPLALLADQLGGTAAVRIEAARGEWSRIVQAGQASGALYLRGLVDGGGLVVALWTHLPAELSGHTGEVSSVLSERLAFVPQQAEASINGWLGQVARELDELLLSFVTAEPTVPLGSLPLRPIEPRDRLAALVERARALGVTVKNPPERPSETYLQRLDQQLDALERQRGTAAEEVVANEERLKLLLEVARQLKVRLREVPQRPPVDWLDKLEQKLAEFARAKGLPMPTALTADPPPEPVNVEALAAAQTLETVPPGEGQHKERIQALLHQAQEEGLDLGRIPLAPSLEWVRSAERKLGQAIEKRRAERDAKRQKEEAERATRIKWLEEQARRLGTSLQIPAFPTADWLARAELRVSSLVLTPVGSGRVVDSGRAERFRKVWTEAASAAVDLGEVPVDPDESWLARAEARIAEALRPKTPIPAVPASSRVRPVLVFEVGTVQEQLWEMMGGEFSIGRHRKNTVQIRDDAGVSRHHCKISAEKGSYVIRDLGSTKGTIVNGVRVDHARLVGGERILVGDTQFVFQLRSA